MQICPESEDGGVDYDKDLRIGIHGIPFVEVEEQCSGRNWNIEGFKAVSRGGQHSETQPLGDEKEPKSIRSSKTNTLEGAAN